MAGACGRKRRRDEIGEEQVKHRPLVNGAAHVCVHPPAAEAPDARREVGLQAHAKPRLLLAAAGDGLGTLQHGRPARFKAS